jgi:hypothetical protein
MDAAFPFKARVNRVRNTPLLRPSPRWSRRERFGVIITLCSIYEGIFMTVAVISKPAAHLSYYSSSNGPMTTAGALFAPA